MSSDEEDAIAAIAAVAKALAKALELAERAGYGSQVRIPLRDAQMEIRYASDLAHERT